MSKDNGGPAFPFGQTDEQSGQLVNGWGSEGMTLRDYMAIHASEEDVQSILEFNGMVSRRQARYMHADALLLERAK